MTHGRRFFSSLICCLSISILNDAFYCANSLFHYFRMCLRISFRPQGKLNFKQKITALRTTIYVRTLTFSPNVNIWGKKKKWFRERSTAVSLMMCQVSKKIYCWFTFEMFRTIHRSQHKLTNSSSNLYEIFFFLKIFINLFDLILN